MTLRKLNYVLVPFGILLSVFILWMSERDRLVNTCLNGNNDAEDIAACTALIEDPDETDETILSQLYLVRAQKYVRLDQDETALRDLDQAIALDDSRWVNYAQRGIVYSRGGAYEAALQDLNTSLGMSPDSVWALLWRAKTYQNMQKYQDALDDYEAVLAISPDDISALKGRSQNLHMLDRMQEALQATLDVLAIVPDDLWTLEKRATLLGLDNQFAAAIENIQHYIQIEPGHSNIHVMLGNNLGKIGETEAAVEAFDAAIALRPNDISPLKSRIAMWLSVKNFDQVIVDAQKAFQLAPRDEQILSVLFLVYVETGQTALADQYFDIYARQSSEFLAVQQMLEALFGKDHVLASWDANIMLFKAFFYAAAPHIESDLAMVTMARYFEIGGPDSVAHFQTFLDRIGLYRGDFDGIYDDDTSKAVGACLEAYFMCFGAWSRQSAL